MAFLTGLKSRLHALTIGLPVPQLPKTAADGTPSDATVVLVLTRVVVDRRQRREFDRQNGLVMSGMGQHQGLLGYAARKELFGNQGWTMSVWADDAARDKFVRSPIHREAIAKSMSALRTVELKRLTVARNALPTTWKAVYRLLSDSTGLRVHTPRF